MTAANQQQPDYRRIGREMAQEKARMEQRACRPDTSAALVLSVILWTAAALIGFVATDRGIAGWIVVAIVAALVIAGIFYRPLRSGLSPAITVLVPLWGFVARCDRVSTCAKLRKARIYTDPDKTKTIPATTWHKNHDTFVKFDGGGEPGMSPDHVRELLKKDARVWKARSFTVSEDSERPGLITLQLSKAATVHTMLDDPIKGTIA